MNSLLDQICKCNDIIKTNLELKKNNVKPFEKKTLIKLTDRLTETTTKINKESKKLSNKNN